MKKHFQELLSLVENVKPESLEKSINNCHAKGLFSLVFHGTENGHLKRAYLASKKVKFSQVQLHSHRYDLRITVLRGTVREQRGFLGGELRGMLFDYHSKWNGGQGLCNGQAVNFSTTERTVPVGTSFILSHKDIHTISCSKDAIWIVEEFGFKSDRSQVLGVPFHIQELYSNPIPYQVEDKVNILKTVLHNIVRDIANAGDYEENEDKLPIDDILTAAKLTHNQNV